MYTELLMGALVAVASPQEPERQAEARQVDIQVAAIEIEIPAIEIPELNFYWPGLEIEVPDMEYYLEDLDLYMSDMELELEPIEIDFPRITIPAVHVDIADWDWYRHEDYQEIETDTTFAVNPNAMLAVRNHAGSIVIGTWNRNEMRVRALHSSEDRVKIFGSENAVKIKSETRHGHPDEVQYEITIPASMGVDLWGFETEISVDGAQNGVRVETMEGNIDVRNSRGELSLRSVEGDIHVTGARGRVEVNGVDGGIVLTDIQGSVFAESIDGELRLEGIESDDVEAKTVDGDVHYDGAIRDDGRYRLTTHDGDVVVAIPEGANVTVSVATFEGEFEADFPLRIDRAEASRKFSFVLGDGSGTLELHSFDGDIQMLRR